MGGGTGGYVVRDNAYAAQELTPYRDKIVTTDARKSDYTAAIETEPATEGNQMPQTKNTNYITMWVIALIVALVGIIGIVSFANAADTFAKQNSVKDTYRDAPAIATVETPAKWSGVWIAALAGYSMSNTELNFSSAFSDGEETFEGPGAGLDGFGGEGFDATVQLGADVQVGRAVIGGWAEYSFGGVESSASVNFGPAGARLDVEQNDSYGAFGRLGLAFGDTLIYGAGGYVWTEADVKISGTGFDTYRETFDFSGPAAELGVEHRFAPGIRGKLAARYTWLDDETLWSDADERFDAKLTGEPGVWSVKAGVVISTEAMFGGSGLGIFTAD